jgi:hypothetical protein
MQVGAEIEYRVRPVTRYIVTSFRHRNGTTGSRQHGEFDNEETAYQVGYALAKSDHEREGWPIDDPRIRYPTRPSEETATPSPRLEPLAMARAR